MRTGLYVRDNAADLVVADLYALDLEVQCVAHPRDRGKLQQQADLALVRALEYRSLRVEAEQSRRPPEVGLENLSDVHSAWNAERVEYDVDGTAIGEERHVLLGNDAGNDTLVAVASRHLVADRDFALLGHVNLHELNDARRQLIRLQHAVNSLLRFLLELGLLFVGQVDDRADSLVHLLVFDAERLEIQSRNLEVLEHLRRQLGARGNRFLDGSGLERERDGLPVEQLIQLGVADFVDADFLLALESADLTDSLAAILLDDLVFDAREDLHVDYHAFHTRRDLERRILHVLRLLTEDRGEELLFRRQLRLALRRDLADEDIARLDVRADADDATFVEIRQRLLGDVRNLSRDLFLAALGVAHVQLELLDVDRRIDVVLHQSLGEHDRVLEVVSVPRHERHGDVGSERELSHFRRRTVSENLSLLHLLPGLHDRALVQRGVLVGAPVLLESITIVLGKSRERPVSILTARLVS